LQSLRAQKTARYSAKDGFPKPRRRVLVVEDDRQAREMYRTALANYGFAVTAVEDGLDALYFLETERPDAVVLDLMLPRVGGYDVYRELRANPATARIPVVIVTGTEARDLGANEFRFFLKKPVRPDSLAECVAAAIRGGGAGI
jgi:CheY-like chemotaxis protein